MMLVKFLKEICYHFDVFDVQLPSNNKVFETRLNGIVKRINWSVIYVTVHLMNRSWANIIYPELSVTKDCEDEI